MDNNFYTFELARIYEEQSIYKKALEQYKFLLEADPLNQKLSHAVERVKKMISGQKDLSPLSPSSTNRLSELFEEWVELLMIKQKYQYLNSI